jgi:hypothetical protein
VARLEQAVAVLVRLPARVPAASVSAALRARPEQAMAVPGWLPARVPAERVSAALRARVVGTAAVPVQVRARAAQGSAARRVPGMGTATARPEPVAASVQAVPPLPVTGARPEAVRESAVRRHRAVLAPQGPHQGRVTVELRRPV